MNELDYFKALQTLDVLYCEDEEAPRRQMKLVLEDCVKNLYIGKDGREGLELFKKHKPDLIITDIKMPDIDGLDMSEAIKKIEPNANIILLTAFDYKNFFQRAIDIGVNQYVIKPIGEVKLFNAINRTLDVIMARKKVEYQSMYIQNILDAQKNLVLVTDGIHISAVNSEFLKFFHYDKLQDIIKDKMYGLRETFQFSEGFYLDPTSFFQDLIGEFLNKKTVVYITRFGQNLTFTCEVTELKDIEGKFLISFNDVSKVTEFITVDKQEKSEEKSLAVIPESNEEEEIPIEDDEDDDLIDSAIDELHSSIEIATNSCSKDRLTDYLQNDAFYDRLDSFTSERERSYSFLAFSFKNFKEINRVKGYEFGDEIIKALTNEFKEKFLYESLFVRFNGVEFGLLVKSDEDEKEKIKANLVRINRDINEELKIYSDKCRCSFSHFSVNPEKIVSLISTIRVRHISGK